MTLSSREVRDVPDDRAVRDVHPVRDSRADCVVRDAVMGSKQYSSTADQRRCLKLNVKLKPMHNKANVWILKLEVQSPVLNNI